MAIRYDSNLNARLRSGVRNYNKKVDRLEKAGYKNLPKKQFVSELKSRYGNRADLIRELNRLESFSRKDLTKKKLDDGNIPKWQYSYIKGNTNPAISYFENEYNRINKRLGKFPGERTYLDTISAKLDLLRKDVKDMTASELRSGVTIINEFATSPSQRKAQYRGFLSEVEWVMEKLDYSKEEIDNFFKKFSTLTPSQFLYAYDNNDIIAKVYSLYQKDYGVEEAHLNDPKAKDRIEELLSRIDIIVEEAKVNMD